MDFNRKLKEYDRVIKSAAHKYAARLLAERPNEYDDVMNEARIAAWRALERYDGSRQVKVETFIFNCVRNKMFDLAKHARRLGRNIATSHEDLDSFSEEDADVAHGILMKQVLSADELNLLTCIRKGGGASKFVYEVGRITRVRTEEARKEVVSCLHHIHLKLTSIEPNPKVSISTRPSERCSGETT